MSESQAESPPCLNSSPRFSHSVDDCNAILDDLHKKNKDVANMVQKGTKLSMCLYIGCANCDAHLVHVPPLPGFDKAENHKQLDVFTWLPGVPYRSSTFSDSSVCRLTVPRREWGAPAHEELHYIFIYYHQESERLLPGPVNNLVNRMIESTCPGFGLPWYGDMLIVKSKPNPVPMLLPMKDSEVSFVQETLIKLLTTGGFA
ncbi:hypothetical protein BDZ97DRAFT_1920449 [Flammula alnicola]|nr:hypothetical protein BDZ97DRAFT_1920449 [Flammula alnicola]